jgi:prepilin-type N-terminal cleavage/methylation domain-containing protein
MTKNKLALKKKSGFTLIELLVVVLIIGILAAIAVPQYFKVVEKGKVAEALAAADALRGAQERYLAAAGGYCVTAAFACTGWDMTPPTMKYFTLGAPAAGTGSPSWKITLTRAAPTPAGYGAYTVVYTQEPAVPPAFTCTGTGCTDLMPQ